MTLRLIGMMDSPFVRRVAISMRLMDLAHEHDQVSVFRHMDRFAAINPVIKAPTLICDDGGTIMESSLILDYCEARAGADKSLMPGALAARQQTLSLIGLAMAALEKSVQIEYERKRPDDKRYAPWLDRIGAQLHAAWGEIEKAALTGRPHLVGDRLTQADVTVAVAWTFTRFIVPDLVAEHAYPACAAFTAAMEATAAFVETPLE